MAGLEIVARGGSCVTHPAAAKGIATMKPRLLMLIRFPSLAKKKILFR